MVNPLNISEMLSQANQMQEEVQRKLGETVVEASSGGGAVTATMNGKKQLLKIRIDPSAVAGLSGGQADVEMLEDLVVAGPQGRRGHSVERAGHAGWAQPAGPESLTRRSRTKWRPIPDLKIRTWAPARRRL